MAKINIMAEARKRTLESMQRVANAAKKDGPSDVATAATSDRKSRMRINYIRWRDKYIEEIRLKARLRYHKNHPGSRKYKKCWNQKEND